MAILKIARMGHPVLLQRAASVPDPTAPAVQRLIADMTETMLDAGGVGLAAPQVHESIRLFVYFVPGGRASDDPDDKPQPITTLINPVITADGPAQSLRWEGCLSIPGLRAAVPRYDRIIVDATLPDGQSVTFRASFFHAGVIQHENDHLDGILYPMRMTDHRLFGFNEELARYPADLPVLS
ncbi:MAG: peptide deformylase [Rhodospirillales bacterium 20-60-12]|nr:MAG: peptide deformylase [Rhodospirillales bacterium 20-60-12]HQT67330.1 peptide deformylase [Acetobacteraceae bacterium]HQU01059.1 peptide deformylase [Acetobacteraceae bacterium]